MRVTNVDETTLDVKWFLIDREGAIGAFATAGAGEIPDSYRESMEELSQLRHFFRVGCEITTSLIVDPSLANRFGLHDRSMAIEYAGSYKHQFSRRGLYFFDCDPEGPMPRGYFRVSLPLKPLDAKELPAEIQRIIRSKGAPHIPFAELQDVPASLIRSWGAPDGSAKKKKGS
jgi:hypothetical protein